MSKFDRYVLSQLLVLFGFFSLVLVAIDWINRTVLVFDQLIADGQSAGAVLSLTALTLPFVIAIVMPLSAFAASVYVTNRLNSESELVVMQATGFSPQRLSVPFVIFGVLVTLMITVLMHVLVPAASQEAARQRADLADNVTARFLSPGEFLHPAQGVTFYIGDLTREGVLEGVFLTDARSPERQTTYMAREAFLLAQEHGPTLVMLDGIAQTLTNDGRRLAVTRFDDFAYDIGRLIAAVRPPKPSPRMLSTPELLRADPARMEELKSTRSAFLWEAHMRFSQSMIAVVAALVGFATLLLGAFSRFGVWRQILGAILILIFLKMFDNAASSFAKGTEGAWPMLYLPVLVGAGICIALLRFAGRNRRMPRRPPPAGASPA